MNYKTKLQNNLKMVQHYLSYHKIFNLETTSAYITSTITGACN